jgi:hypothetical protein
MILALGPSARVVISPNVRATRFVGHRSLQRLARTVTKAPAPLVRRPTTKKVIEAADRGRLRFSGQEVEAPRICKHPPAPARSSHRRKVAAKQGRLTMRFVDAREPAASPTEFFKGRGAQGRSTSRH